MDVVWSRAVPIGMHNERRTAVAPSIHYTRLKRAQNLADATRPPSQRVHVDLSAENLGHKAGQYDSISGALYLEADLHDFGVPPSTPEYQRSPRAVSRPASGSSKKRSPSEVHVVLPSSFRSTTTTS